MAETNNNSYKLKWQKDFETYFDVYSSFVFEGLIDDLQPYREGEGDPLNHLPIYEYISKVYGSQNENPDRRKLVIVYDPTESDQMKFNILGDVGLPVPDEEANNTPADAPAPNAEGQPQTPPAEDKKIKIDYKLQYGKKLAQRFYDILHNEEINKLLIGHDSDGPSLDIAKIHYALSYESQRSDSFVDNIKDKLSSIFGFGDNLTDDETGYIFIFKMASRLLSRDGGESNGLSPDELTIFRELLSVTQMLENDEQLKGKHKIIILANNARDLPKWFVDENMNPFIKTISISKPSEVNRIAFFNEVILPDAECFDANGKFMERFQQMEAEAEANKKRNPFYNKFLGYTNDFSTKQLIHYHEYLHKDKLDDPMKVGFSVSKFIAGDLTNPWDDQEKVQQLLHIKEAVEKKIKGQGYALDSVQAILKRAALGIDRDENPNAPRAILFLAGPTGTGKTEICKQIAETIFGSEERIVRFDMSEYGEKESDQKLFGAPPGYIGYEEGGKLTNAIKKEPFSLVLFDEIEKAHNSILDKFLQILGDGRLTDGKGETVRFTDTIIAITSNAGVSKGFINGLSKEDIKEKMNGEDEPKEAITIKTIIEEENRLLSEKGQIDEADEKAIYERLKEYLRYNVKFYFNCQLGRPELYGRVEDSIVYYNYIGRNSVGLIANGKIKSVSKTTEENFSCHVETPDSVKKAIADYCQNEHVRGIGARGITKTTGLLFSTSLSKKLGEYITRDGGREELRGATLVASCPDKIESPDDIHWEVRTNGSVSGGNN